MKKIALITAVLTLSFLPLLAFAQASYQLPNVWAPASIKWQLVTCTGNISNLPNTNPANLNPCTSLCDLITTAENDIYLGIAFVIWFIIPIMLVVAGIMYMMGGANPGLLSGAKSAIKGAIIGAIIVLCAYLLISTLVTFLKIGNIGGFSNGVATCQLSS